jgi:signal transduction histidine kinase
MFPDILQAAREEGRGLGVGLRGMQGRVTQLGGRFEIESSGRGTTVRAVLPLEAAGPFAGAP